MNRYNAALTFYAAASKDRFKCFECLQSIKKRASIQCSVCEAWECEECSGVAEGEMEGAKKYCCPDYCCGAMPSAKWKDILKVAGKGVPIGVAAAADGDEE